MVQIRGVDGVGRGVLRLSRAVRGAMVNAEGLLVFVELVNLCRDGGDSYIVSFHGAIMKHNIGVQKGDAE